MLISASVLCGFGLDLLFGDPPSLPHPVVLMGKCIEALEHILRGIFPKSKRGELWAGVVLAAILPLGTLA
ncbi:MAG: cobalamin biosynthesis protein, partial [Angelakisella sp.]